MALSLLIFLCISDCLAEEPYHVQKEIVLGSEAISGSLAVDEVAHRLYVPLQTKIAIVDLTNGQVFGEITNMPNISQVTIAAKQSLGFFCSEVNNKVRIFNLGSSQEFATANTGKNPVATLFEPSHAELYSFNSGDQSASHFEADDGDFMGAIEFPGKPAGAILNPDAGRIYCTIENENEVAVIDVKTHKVIEHWPLGAGKNPSGIAIDLARHRIFVGCRNKLMVVFDLGKGTVVTTAPIAEGVDNVAYDPKTRLVFGFSKEGAVSICHQDTPDQLSVVQTVKTLPGSHAMALDSVTHKLYVTVFDHEVKPSNSKVIVYEKSGSL